MVNEFVIVDNLRILSSDRIFISGRTGTGKTHLVKYYLLPHYNKYVFYDVKRENSDVIHDVIITTPKELKNNINKYDKVLYQPKNLTDKDFNDVCEIVFNARDNTLYMDEAALVSSPTKILYWHRILVTQGRSYGVGSINTTQRPRDVNNTLISEAEHLFVFSLNLETDIVKIKQMTGTAADEVYFLPEHHFLYYNVRTNKSIIIKPIRKYTTDEKTGQIIIQKLEIYKPSLEEYLSIVQ